MNKSFAVPVIACGFLLAACGGGNDGTVGLRDLHPGGIGGDTLAFRAIRETAIALLVQLSH